MKRIGLLSLALVMLGAFAAAVVAGEAAKPAKAGKGMHGMVSSVDTNAKSVTIDMKKKDKKESMTVTVADDAKIKVNGKDAKLADVKAGMSATLVLSDDGKMAKEVSAHDVKKAEGKKEKGGK